MSACRKVILDSCLPPSTKIALKGKKDLNARAEILELQKEKERKTFQHISITKNLKHFQLVQEITTNDK